MDMSDESDDYYNREGAKALMFGMTAIAVGAFIVVLVLWPGITMTVILLLVAKKCVVIKRRDS